MKNAFSLLILLVVVFGVCIFAVERPAVAADPAPGIYTFGTYTGSISASNAQIGSAIASTDQLVIRSLTVHSTQTGVLTITDGSAGVAKLCLGVLANTPQVVTADQLGPAGLKFTKGAEPYVNALSSATVAISYAGTLE